MPGSAPIWNASLWGPRQSGELFNAHLLEYYLQGAFLSPWPDAIPTVSTRWPDDFLSLGTVPTGWWHEGDMEVDVNDVGGPLVAAVTGVVLTELLATGEIILLDSYFDQGATYTEILSIGDWMRESGRPWQDWIRIPHGSFSAGEWAPPWEGWVEVSFDAQRVYLYEAQRRLPEWPTWGWMTEGATRVIAELAALQVGHEARDSIYEALEQRQDLVQTLAAVGCSRSVEDVLASVTGEVERLLADSDGLTLEASALAKSWQGDWGITSAYWPPVGIYPRLVHACLTLPFLPPESEGDPGVEPAVSAMWAGLEVQHQEAIVANLILVMDSHPAWLPLALIARNPGSSAGALRLAALSSAESVMEGLMLNPMASEDVRVTARLEREAHGIKGQRHAAD